MASPVMAMSLPLLSKGMTGHSIAVNFQTSAENQFCLINNCSEMIRLKRSLYDLETEAVFA
jgi:hypothetical protein